MGFTFNGITFSGSGLTVSNPVLDPVISSTSLLLKTGSQLTQNTVVTDSSVNNFTVTRNGSPSTNWPSPYSDFWSGYFGGTSDYLSTTSSTILQFSSSAYTVEGWIYQNARSGTQWICGGVFSGTGFQLGINSSGYIFGSVPGIGDLTVATIAISLNTWTHFALVRTSTSTNGTAYYINGVAAGTVTDANNYSGTATTFNVATTNNNTSVSPLNGYLSNFRVVKGVAVYTGAFTPPTAPLTATQAAGTNIAAITGTQCSLLTCASNRFIDTGGLATPNTITVNGSAQISSQFYPTTFTLSSQLAVNFATGYWSGFFNGSSYLTTATGIDNFAAGQAYTVECWFYTNSSSATGQVILQGGPNTFSLVIVGSTGTVYVGKSSVIDFIATTGSFQLNAWYHLAVARNTSNQTRCWVNGTSVGSTSSDTYAYNDVAPNIGAANPATAYFNGYISNLRVVKGTAVYDPTQTTITVPTSPLTAITNTSLLTLQNGRFVDNSTNAFTITANGSPYLTPYLYPTGFVLPAPTGSGYFPGNSSYLSIGATSAFNFGTGAFSIECWFNVGNYNNPGFQHIISINQYTNGILVRPGNLANQIEVYIGGTSYQFNISLSTNVWYNLAVTRSAAGSLKCFLNGTQIGSTLSSTYNIIGNSSNTIASAVHATSENLIGYLGSMRVSNIERTITGVSTTPYTNDANTVLLLNLGDSNFTTTVNAAQNNTFIDNSNYAFPITRTGTPTQGAFTPYQPSGYWSNYFNGSSYTRSVGFNFSTNDFTIELFLNTAFLGAGPQFLGGYDSSGQNYTIAMNAGGVLGYFLSSDGANWNIASNTTLGTVVANKWHHIVIARTGNKIRGYFDGTGGTIITTSAAIYNNATNFWLGAAGAAGGNLTGYISNVRILNGSSAYDANQSTITVPTAPFATNTTNQVLLTCQANRFIDSNTATTEKTITVTGTPSVQSFQPFSLPAAYTPTTYGGSGYFGGSGNYLSIARNAALIPTASQNFTFEAWVYLTATPSAESSQVFGFQEYGTSSDYIFLINSSLVPYLWISAIAGTLTTGPAITLNSWNHIAIERKSGNTLNVYTNGVAGSPVTSTTTLVGSGGNQFTIGADQNGDESVFIGYISNARIVIGSTVYGSNFTPPTTPLTAVTNTSLLTNFTNAGIYDAAWQNNALTVGDAQASTTITAKWPPTSMKFDGTGDYLDILNSSPAFNLTSGDWTIEAWIYRSVANANHCIINLVNAFGSNSGLSIYVNSSNQLAADNGIVGALSGGTVPANQWVYLAIVRSSGTTTGYVNGTSIGTNTQAPATAQYARIGALGGGGSPFNGYIQDLRITKGYARYLFTFASPTETFVAGGGVGSVPGAVTIGTATATSGTTATVTYTPSANLGGYAVSAYTATSSPGSITGTGASPITVSGLTAGTTYSFTVKATNVLGDSTASSASNSITTPLPLTVEYLVVAGGGGAGQGAGPNGWETGGGGAGGLLTGTKSDAVVSTNYTVTVGGGGGTSTTGSNSVFSTITSSGGGSGGGGSGAGGAGGSGGGAGSFAATGGTGIVGQGKNGGAGASSAGGGGGGAGVAGSNASNTVGGNGGNGLQSSITGTATYYAGGGGGGVTVSSGGLGGGANGSTGNGNAGTPNTGGGGGGSAGSSNSIGGSGGSGIVILKIPNNYTATFSGGITSTLSTAVAGYKIYSVTAGTGTVSFA